MAIDATGNAIAVWTLEGGNFIVQAAVRPAGGDWAAPDDLSDAGQDAGEPAVAMNEAGEAVAAWTRLDGTDTVQAAVRPAGGDWARPDDLSAAGQDAGNRMWRLTRRARRSRSGAATTAATSSSRRRCVPRAASGRDPDDLSASGQDGLVPSRGDERRCRCGSDVVSLRWRQPQGPGGGAPADGDWSKPDTLSAAGENAAFPDVALDAAGNAIAVFGRNGDDGPFVQASGYDFVGPRLSDLQIPAAGTVGEPVTFGVSSFDVFPLATSWTFGDGGPGASGNTVSHVYTAPGAYPVTVNAVDAGGNASTRIGAIAIARRRPPPPPRPRSRSPCGSREESLRKLRRTGTLRVAASVNEAASVALSGRAKLKVRRARGGTRTKLVPVFAPKTVRFAAAAEGKVTLALSKRGRKALRSLSRVRLLIAGEARDDAGGTATKTVARTLR